MLLRTLLMRDFLCCLRETIRGIEVGDRKGSVSSLREQGCEVWSHDYV